jgi:hypothetical protein
MPALANVAEQHARKAFSRRGKRLISNEVAAFSNAAPALAFARAGYSEKCFSGDARMPRDDVNSPYAAVEIRAPMGSRRASTPLLDDHAGHRGHDHTRRDHHRRSTIANADPRRIPVKAFAAPFCDWNQYGCTATRYC